jgi:hypothetical protein
MRKVYEVWAEIEDGRQVGTTMASAEGIREQLDKGLLRRDAQLLFRIDADTPEEAHAVLNIKMGWGSYEPTGKAVLCPNSCGALFYPESSGECPNCGKIC